MGDSPYTPAAGLGSVPNVSANPGLLEDAVNASKYDYSDVLGKLTAEKEQAAKLALVSRGHDQLDFEEAQRKADLATLNAKRAEMDMHARALSDPKYLEALSAEHAATIAANTRVANSQAAGDYQTEKDAAELGLDQSAYSVDGKVDHLALAADVQRLKQRNTFLGQGYTMDGAKKATGPTMQEAWETPATSDTPDAAAGGGTPNPAGTLSNSPSPAATLSASTPSTSLDALPAPVKLPPITLSGGQPVAADPTAAPAAVPAPSGAPTATLPEGVAPNAPTSLAAARETMRIPVARQEKIAPQFVTDRQLDDALGVATTKEIYVDPKTQDSYEVQVTKDRAGRIYSTSAPILHERSKTQQVIDSAAAADYQDYTQNHGAARDKNDLATLDEAIGIMKDGHTTVSGALTSLLPEGLRNVVLSNKGLKVPQLIKSVVQNHLKEIFGGRVSNMEVKNAMELVFNPALDEDTNVETAGRVRRDIVDAMENKRASMQYFGAHGTLEGFEAPGLEPAAVGSTSTGSATGAAGAGTTSGRAQLGDAKFLNGRKYVLFPADGDTGKRVWVGQ